MINVMVKGDISLAAVTRTSLITLEKIVGKWVKPKKNSP
ncbi:hypothetical protein FM106_12610 [Brachybacterium faecium]|nr:hypothetical protein FM106_12610 [Brachybacterium faecium]